MKRRITVEQLNELTDEQKKTLRDWWKPQEGDYFYAEQGLDIGSYLFQNCCHFSLDLHFGNDEEPNIEDSEFGGKWYIKNCLPLLDISQMIDFIYEYEECFEIDSSAKWFIETRSLKDRIVTSDEELCDALFDVVKILLRRYSDEN